MVKHTQTILRLLPANCLRVFGHFAVLALKGFKVNKRNSSARCEICLKLAIKTPAWGQLRHSSVFISNQEIHTYFPYYCKVSIVDFEHVIHGYYIYCDKYLRGSFRVYMSKVCITVTNTKKIWTPREEIPVKSIWRILLFCA